MDAPNIEQAVTIRKDALYTIDDLPITVDSKVMATVSVTHLNGGQMTRGHLHESQAEFYYFIEGEGDMQLGTTEEYRVRENSVIYVPAGVFHRVKNRNDYASLIFYTFFQGASDRPKF